MFGEQKKNKERLAIWKALLEPGHMIKMESENKMAILRISFTYLIPA